jgi:hypothetical protein
VLGKYKSKWSAQNEKARAWLHIQVGDEKLENDILESCKKVIVEKVFNKNIKKLKYKTEDVPATLIILQSKTTPETAKKILNCQRTNGSIKLDKTISDQINISSDNLQSSIQAYGVSKKLKTISKDVWETALSLRYLTITSQSQDQHKEQSEKAKEYLIEELKNEKLVDELLTTSDKIIIEQSVKKKKDDVKALPQPKKQKKLCQAKRKMDL